MNFYPNRSLTISLFALTIAAVTTAGCIDDGRDSPENENIAADSQPITYSYNITNNHSGLCLNVLDFSTVNGGNVVQATNCSIISSIWSFDFVEHDFYSGHDYFNIHSQWSEKCLNVLNESGSNGANVVQADACDIDSSKWRIEAVDADSARIVAKHSGQCLNVLNLATHNGANVVQAVDCTIPSSMWDLQVAN